VDFGEKRVRENLERNNRVILKMIIRRSPGKMRKITINLRIAYILGARDSIVG
jgi:hypothetical protein